MPDPFRLFGRLLIAGFKVTGYSVVFVLQVVLYAMSGRPDKIGDAAGYLGRGVVDALERLFE